MSWISHKVVPKLSSISPSVSFIYKIQKRPKYVNHTWGYSWVQTSADGFLELCTSMSSTVCQTSNSYYHCLCEGCELCCTNKFFKSVSLTLVVYAPSVVLSISRLNPKSAILQTSWALTNTLRAARSLWT